MEIRTAGPGDISRLIELCAAHAGYEKCDYAATGKGQRLAELLCHEPTFEVLVVETQQQLVGYAAYVKQVSTWHAAHYLYLDCLFICEEFRGRGFGTKLMQKIAARAKALGCHQIQWQTPCENFRAIKFYDSLKGTTRQKKFRYAGPTKLLAFESEQQPIRS